MAQAIHHEARGESSVGREQVGHVIMNRVRSGRFGRGVCGVVFRRGQFTRISRGIRPDSGSFRAARAVLGGNSRNLVGNRLYFSGKAPRGSMRVGNHRFW